jgi:HrpA-like RNA helicase
MTKRCLPHFRNCENVAKVSEGQEAGIVDRPDINSKIRTEESVHYICIQALAPSNRPVQVTENLVLFWRGTYPKFKQQLWRKYPKHDWR